MATSETPHAPRHSDRRRRPLIGRDGRSGYLVAMAVSFALTVTLTRAFLAASGYPKVGGATFHLAHAVWGGLILIGTSIGPLLYASRRVFTVSAVLSGIGAGLFIDEIGKFITTQNDYFFPLAATLIYIFGLGMVWLAIQVNQKRGLDEATMASACLELLGDVVDRSLTVRELARLNHYAQALQNADFPAYREVGTWVQHMVNEYSDVISPREPGRTERVINRVKLWEISHANEKFYRRAISVLVFVEILTIPLALIVAYAVVRHNDTTLPMLQEFYDPGSLDTFSEQVLYVGVSLAMIVVQIANLVGLVLFTRRHSDRGSRMMMRAMLAQVVVVNTLSGYFDIVQLVVRLLIDVPALVVLIRYRQRFVVTAEEE
jgi:hypothetical protein